MTAKYHKATYQAVAEILATTEIEPATKDALVRKFAQLFRLDNPLYDDYRFKEACWR